MKTDFSNRPWQEAMALSAKMSLPMSGRFNPYRWPSRISNIMTFAGKSICLRAHLTESIAKEEKTMKKSLPTRVMRRPVRSDSSIQGSALPEGWMVSGIMSRMMSTAIPTTVLCNTQNASCIFIGISVYRFCYGFCPKFRYILSPVFSMSLSPSSTITAWQKIFV